MDTLRRCLRKTVPLDPLNHVEKPFWNRPIHSAKNRNLYREGWEHGDPWKLAVADESRAAPLKIKAKGVRTRFDRVFRICGVNQAADFNPCVRYQPITFRTASAMTG